MLLLALLLLLLALPAGAIPLEFEVLPGQPGVALQQSSEGVTLSNAGEPFAHAYAPVEMARGTFTLSFEARADQKRRASVRFATERVDFEASPEWTRHGLTVESPGSMGPSGVTLALDDRQGKLEIRKLSILRMAFRTRVRAVPELVVQGGEGVTLVGVLMTTDGEAPPGVRAEFRTLPTRAWNAPWPAEPEPIGVVTQKDAREVAVTWVAQVPPQGTVFVREPIEPTLLRWRLVDEQGQIVHEGGALRLGPSPPRPAAKTPGRVYLRQDGVTVVDGRPWFPLGLYTRNQEFDSARRLGLNLAIMRADTPPAVVAAAHKQGLEVILHTPIRSAAEVPELVRRLAPLPTVAWSLVDEPDQQPAMMPQLEGMYVGLARLDPRPLYQANHTPLSLALCGEAADILALDPYPLRTQPAPVATVARWMDQARALLPPGRALWYVNQAFVLPPLWSRPPTPEQLRCMNWLALNHGARGIVYYSLWEEGWDLMSSPLADSIQKQSAELLTLSPYFLSKHAPVRVDLDGPVDAAVFQDDRDRRLLSLVNISDRNLNGRLELVGIPTVQELPAGAPVSLPPGGLEFHLAPYQVRLYTLGGK